MWSMRDHLFFDATTIMTPEQIAEYGGSMPLATDPAAWTFKTPITTFIKWENFPPGWLEKPPGPWKP
jgi:hypothetical protein